MFDFRKISFEDKEWITKCLAVSDFRGAEYCFANNMAWQRLNDTVITHHGDFYISCSFEDGQPYFTFPAGVKIDVEANISGFLMSLKNMFPPRESRLGYLL